MGAIDVRDLARAAAAGDQHGWDGLVERFGELVWSTTRAYGLSPGEGADAAQTTWLRLAEQLGHLKDQHERIGVWLAATARRESLRLLGAARGVAAAAAPPRPATEPPPGPPGAGEQGREALLWRVVRELPEHCRRLLRVLLSVPPPSHEEVSAALDLPVAGIAAARDACLQDFRHRMSDFSIRADADDS
jgi:DNA-directed RNA polymerase specialized sigma24 family protein